VKEAGGEAIAIHYELGDPDSIRSALTDLNKDWGIKMPDPT
jgi:hypothetical protein